MKSEKKSAASRANGAKSRGPKSPETRQKSSRNSVTHGFTAKKTIVLACENPEHFQEMLTYYAATYQPGSPVEDDLVAEMVAARWRMQRLRMIETALLDSEMERELPQAAPEDGGYKVAFAFRRLVDESHAISLASRYESRLHRIHERSHRTLRELQQTRREQNVVSTLPPAVVSTLPPAVVSTLPPTVVSTLPPTVVPTLPPTADPPAPAPAPPEPPPGSPVCTAVVAEQPPPSSTPARIIPLTPKPEPKAAHSIKKLQIEPEPSTLAKNDRRRISIAGHGGFLVEVKRFRRFGQLKVA